MEFAVWDIRRITAAQMRQWFQALSAAHQARILELRRTESQVSRLCAHRLALEMLSRRTGLAMDALQIVPDALGKPQVRNADVHFNISHSGNFVACAVDARPVGIDLEELRPVRPALLKRVCAEEEMALAAAGSAGFFQIWTAKEALLKCQGTGIRTDLRQVCVVQNGKLHVDGLELVTQTTQDYVLCIVFHE